MFRSSLLLVMTFSMAALPAHVCPAAEPQSIVGKVTHVTLYRGQALVGRTLKLEGAKGVYEFVISDLPTEIVEGTLFAESGTGVEVRAVRLRQRAVGEEPREEVRKISQQIQKVRDDLQLNEQQLELLGKRSQYLDNLETFVANTAKGDLAKGVLNAESLEKISTFSFTEREQISIKQVTLAREKRTLEEQLSLLHRTQSELSDGAQKIVSEVLLFLEKLADGPETIRLYYIVNGCGWTPHYTLRADGTGKEVEMEYNALIEQLTGEDWKDVQLTLSTATPALSAAGPGLAPFYVGLNRVNPANPQANTPAAASLQAVQQQLASQYRGTKERQVDLNRKLQNATSLRENLDFNWELNSVANESQTFEIANPREMLQMPGERNDSDSQSPSLSYPLTIPVSLASRTDQQMVRIFKKSLPSIFYHVATPLISEYVYREAEIKNTSDVDLLGGPLTVYLEGRFVGRSESASVTRGQAMIVGFGIDPQLRAARELLERKEAVQGGNRELSFKYLLSVENYAKEAIQLRLFDRIPYGERAGEIRVKLNEPKVPLSTDARHLRTERTKGILRWDVEIPVGANLEKAFVVDYGFTIDHDRTMSIAPSLQSDAAKLEEFQELQRRRSLKMKFE